MSEKPTGPLLGPEVDPAPAPRPSRTVLEGAGVRIEPLDPQKHGDALWAACGEGKRDAMWAYMAVGPFPDRASFDAYLERFSKSEDPLAFAIVTKPENRAAGIVAYLRIEPAHRVIEVGNIWYGEALQGSAAATEAMYLLAKHAFDDLGYRRYEWKTNTFNAASRKAAERLGFTFEGVFRNHMIMKGRNRDTAWFAMLEEEWPLARRAFEAYLDPANFEGSRHKKSLPEIRESLAKELLMPNRLSAKRALVAAGQGIGRACAAAFAAEGAEVIATDLDSGKLEGLRCIHKALDVRSTEAVQALAAEIGPVDILLNAAGFVHHGSVLECTEADWEFSFDLNVKSMHRTIAAFLPGMLERGGGSIINIASGASSVRGIPNRYVYGASKAAVIGLTKAVAADFIRQAVRCNAICPGTIESPSLDERIVTLAAATGQSIATVRQAFVDRQPMGRLGTPEEVAMLAVYLASDEASYTTGHIHLVDGGFAL